MGKYDQFKWSSRDNKIASLELKMSLLLTRELTDRPAISIALLLESHKVREKITPLLRELESILGYVPILNAEVFLEMGIRKVLVTVKERNASGDPQ